MGEKADPLEHPAGPSEKALVTGRGTSFLVKIKGKCEEDLLQLRKLFIS